MTLPFIPDGQHEKWKSLTIFFITTGYNENLNKKRLGVSLPKWCLFTPSAFQHGYYIIKLFQIPGTSIFNMLVEKGRRHMSSMEDSYLKLFCIKNSLLSSTFNHILGSTLFLIKIKRSDILNSPKMDLTFLI